MKKYLLSFITASFLMTNVGIPAIAATIKGGSQMDNK